MGFNLQTGFQVAYAAGIEAARAGFELADNAHAHALGCAGNRTAGEGSTKNVGEGSVCFGLRFDGGGHLPDRLGVVPSYYLRYFYAHDEVVRELRTKPSRAEEVARMERELLEMYGDPALAEKPALLAERGGAYYSEAAVDLAAALLRGLSRG